MSTARSSTIRGVSAGRDPPPDRDLSTETPLTDTPLSDRNPLEGTWNQTETLWKEHGTRDKKRYHNPVEQRDRCKIITLPQTSFAGGNNFF